MNRAAKNAFSSAARPVGIVEFADALSNVIFAHKAVRKAQRATTVGESRT